MEFLQTIIKHKLQKPLLIANNLLKTLFAAVLTIKLLGTLYSSRGLLIEKHWYIVLVLMTQNKAVVSKQCTRVCVHVSC
jgi:hypothetical protein